jgi:glycosyltransferase involved in cell wall biosynthesis
LLSIVSKMKTPKVSIITVVYNAAGLLERTIRNINEQTYKNIEYLVIDGGSTDGTVEVIKKYSQNIDYSISEKDNGLYDAMNKGLLAATGDFVWFINAGDLIYTRETLSQIFDHDGPLNDIYYGDTMVVDENYSEIGLRRLRPPKHLSWKSFKKGMLVCHQAILINRTIAEPYDLRYPHSADFDWVIKALKKTTSIRNTHLIFAAFLDGGKSKRTIKPSLKERFDSMRVHYGLASTLMHHIPIALRFLIFLIRYKRF